MRFARDRRLQLVTGVLILLGVVSCLFDEDGDDCICTANFVSVTFTVVSSTGEPQSGIDIVVTNIRTGAELGVDQRQADSGVYAVIDDSYRRSIPESGEHLRVVGTLGTSVFTEMFSVGVDLPCRCHVRKLSGPGTITFD